MFRYLGQSETISVGAAAARADVGGLPGAAVQSAPELPRAPLRDFVFAKRRRDCEYVQEVPVDQEDLR